MQHRYFAASNSSQGFKNYYPEVFARADLIYIIKGGPGTGKSSLMKRYAHRAESKGLKCEYYYCSSDPNSLDGVLIHGENRITGILDGTAPHTCEPRFPGAREEIINLGEFWDGELLRKQKNEIIALSERKSAEYKSAYTFLRSVGNLRAVRDGLISDVLQIEKMRASVRRIAESYPTGKMRYLPAITDSVSMNGRVRLDTFEKNAKKKYLIKKFYGVEHILLAELFAAFNDRDVSARISFDPVTPEHVDGIYLEDDQIAFVIDHNNDNPPINDTKTLENNTIMLNSKRFVDIEALRDIRSELRYTARLAQSSLDGAIHALSKAKIYHFLLEDIYGKAMDWKRFSELDILI